MESMVFSYDSFYNYKWKILIFYILKIIFICNALFRYSYFYNYFLKQLWKNKWKQLKYVFYF